VSISQLGLELGRVLAPVTALGVFLVPDGYGLSAVENASSLACHPCWKAAFQLWVGWRLRVGSRQSGKYVLDCSRSSRPGQRLPCSDPDQSRV